MAHLGHNLYRLLFSERTILREGTLLLAGLVTYGAGSMLEQPRMTSLGLWMTAPFTATVIVVLVVLVPMHWLASRKT